MDSFSEGVVVFDAEGLLSYANQRAREIIDGLEVSDPRSADQLLPELARLGGRIVRLRVGDLNVGEAVFVPGEDGPHTLAERERAAIVRTLDQTGWRLAETARRLGISRTTLWRRLRAYGLHREKPRRWARTS